MEAIDRLPEDCKALVLDYLSHHALRRLGSISQVGLSVYPQQTRLQHTLESLALAAEFIRKAPSTTSTVRRHLVAAVALEDTGRAPFSNSLEALFTNLPGLVAGQALDVQRSILVVKHLEKTEKFLSRHDLSPSEIVELLHGRVPWRRAHWVKRLIRGPVDIDRLQYVPGDMAYADGVYYDVSALARSVIMNETADTAILDSSSLDSVLDFLLQRARMYIDVYYEPAKLALELVVSDFLRQVWEVAERRQEDWADISEPRTVKGFLQWTDLTVLSAFEGVRWDREVPESLRRLRLLIREGQLQVAELRQRGTSIVDLQNLQLVVTAIRDQLLSREHRWLLGGEDLPRLQVYHPGSISVSHKGRYRDLAETPELSANPDVVRRMRRSPLVVFPTAEFGEVQFVVHEAGLVLQNVVPLDGIRRLLESSDFGSSNPTAER